MNDGKMDSEQVMSTEEGRTIWYSALNTLFLAGRDLVENMLWELPVLTTLIVSIFGFWWIYSPHSSYEKALYVALYVLLCALPILVDPRPLAQHLYTAGYTAFLESRFDVLLVHHFKMVLTLGAVVWLLHRSWQTLWKPVPDLINILGVDVPESPDVSLAGIRPDAATLSWTRPTSNRPVQKYSIQVNGVHVGDSPGNEVAITVTGLKPNHFYNIRVVAVGQNHFQAGSEVVRLRTYAKDGKPQLGNSRLPANFTNNENPRVICDDDNDESETHKPSLPSVEAAPVLNGNTALAGDITSSMPGTRRNTVNRRHSPSVASMDQPQIRPPLPDGPELSLDELTRKFEGIRKEMDDTLSLCAKDEAEFQQQEDELKKEKDRKRQALKEKEEQTTQLKGMVRTTMEQMRGVEKERQKKEQQLKDKETKKTKIRETVAKLEHEIERMRKEREGFQALKISLEEKRDCSVLNLDKSNLEVQEKCLELEKELKEKGKQLQDLKASRENIPGGEHEQRREDDLRAQREWAAKRDELNARLIAETRRTAQLDAYLNDLGEQLLRHQSELAFFNHADGPGLDFDPSASTLDKRHSQNSGSLSNTNLSPPPGQFASLEGNFLPSSALGRAGFSSGLFMDIAPEGSDENQTEADLRAAGGPLSPTAHALLPSGIFDEMFDGPEPEAQDSPLLPTAITAVEEDDPKSPPSSGRSISILSSPHDSLQNLPFPQYTDGDQKSLDLAASPVPPPATGHRLASLLSTFQRSKTSKISEEGGPPIGSLKMGQSQSFPRGADETDGANKRRKSFSWMKPHAEAEGIRGSPSSASKPFSARRLFPFGSSAVANSSDRDLASSRPASISSSDLPRPSTDSGSIWNHPGDFSAISKSRFWSPNEGGRWQSRNGSRRPSIHGSPSLLETTLASADDEILDDDDLLDPQTSPSQVGVIGSRPPGHRASISQRLNPAAPTFMASLFGTKDKTKDGNADKDKGKGKEKERQRDKSREGKGKGKEAVTPLVEVPPSLDDSPSDSRISRDTYSVHTQNSVSESHESLHLLDTNVSSTSDMHAASHKEPENVVKKLFRKGSSSKFSLSSRLGMDSSLFKKGPGSATNSDKNMSNEHRSSIGDIDDLGEDVTQLGRSYDSITSSPSLGPSISRGKEVKEGRMSNWRFSIKKKGKEAQAKEKESLDMDRAPDDD